MGRRRKGSRGAKNTTDSGSQAAKFSEKNVEENEQKDSDTQGGNESSKDVAYNQREGMDTVEIATDTPTTTPSAAIVKKEEVFKAVKDCEKVTNDTRETSFTERVVEDEVIKVGKDSEKATSDTPETSLTERVVEDEVIKVGKDSEKAISDTPETSLTERVVEDEVIKVGKDSEKATSDNKAADKSMGNKSPRKELIEHETKVRSELTTGVHKIESLASNDSKGPEELFARRRLWPAAEAFLARVPPIQYIKDAFSQYVEPLQVSTRKDIDERKRMLDSKDTKTQQVMSYDNECTITKPKMEVNVPMTSLQYFKDHVEQEQKLDVKASKPQQRFSSENERTAITKNLEENQSTIWEQSFKDYLGVVQKLCLKDLETQQDPSYESFLIFLNAQLDELKAQQELLSETDSTVNEPDSEVNVSDICLPLFKDLLKEQPNLQQNVLRKQPELSLENERTETKTEVRQTKPLLKYPELMDIDGNLQNLDLNASKGEQDPSSEDQSNLNEPQTKEYDESINLKRDVNLGFHIDRDGNKSFFVDDKLRYVANGKQKITFNIGDGNAQLSFIDNKVSISTQGGQIDCSMINNRFVFSLTDSATKSGPLPECTRDSQVQRRLKDSLENFLTNVRNACEDLKKAL